MQTGALMLAFLGMTVGQASNDVYITNQRNQKIPVELPPAGRQTVSQLRLYASTDQGRSWQQVDAITPDKDGFVFLAKNDGSYWFRVAAVNLQGRQEPENIYQGAPDQKMIVDTVKPMIDMSAQRQGDEILASWNIHEDHPDMQGLRLDWRAKEGSPSSWNVAPFDGNLRGQTQFRVNHQGAILLRMQVRDLAKNLSFREVEVNGTGIALTAGQGGQFNNSSSNYVQPPPSYAPPPSTYPTDPGFCPPPEREPLPPTFDQDLPRKVLASNDGKTMQHRQPGNPDEQQRRMLATSQNLEPNVPPQPKQSNLPQVRFLNSTNLTFEYEISKLSPSGIGVVEVYWTLNDGGHWEQYADDPKSGPSMLPGRYKRRIELPGDGVYGFTCLALSRAAKEMKDKAGVNPGNKPKEGDAPEIRVEVDTIPPIVELFAPVPDKQRENTLILSWTAKDKNLAAEPISLEWAENPEGPWQACGGKQTNTGRFSWTLPQRIPVQVFLRVKAADLAGNEGIAVTQEPLYVDLGQPQARIVDVFVTQQAP